MKATVLDLRYHMKKVLKALDRRERVTLLYHGKVKGMIMPAGGERTIKVEEHPLFNLTVQDEKSVAQQMEELRRSRFNAL